MLLTLVIEKEENLSHFTQKLFLLDFYEVEQHKAVPKDETKS